MLEVPLASAVPLFIVMPLVTVAEPLILKLPVPLRVVLLTLSPVARDKDAPLLIIALPPLATMVPLPMVMPLFRVRVPLLRVRLLLTVKPLSAVNEPPLMVRLVTLSEVPKVRFPPLTTVILPLVALIDALPIVTPLPTVKLAVLLFRVIEPPLKLEIVLVDDPVAV